MRIAGLAALLLLISGCQYDPYVEVYTTTKPEKADVAGRYMLTQQTIQPGGLSVFKEDSSVIELRDDGTFTATNLPAQDSEPGDEKFFSKLVSGSGTWQIDVVGSIANGGRPPKQQFGVQFESENANFKQVGFSGSAPPFGLIITLGDPDGGHVMIYERAK